MYGLAPGEYASRLAAQGGRCAICGKKPQRRRLAVDHNHFSGEVRGLLCYFCNSALGIWEFDRDTARRAAEYLAAISKGVFVETSESIPPVAPAEPADDLPF